MSVELKHPEIILSNKGHDFSGWFNEKALNVLRALSHIVDCSEKITGWEKQEPYGYDEEFFEHLNDAIHDAVKLVAIITGRDEIYEKSDSSIVFDSGYSGLRDLMKKYEMPERIDIQKEILEQKDQEARKELSQYLSGHKSNRTMIHVLLRKMTVKADIESQMEKDIEDVTMGIASWERFTEKYKGYSVS